MAAREIAKDQVTAGELRAEIAALVERLPAGELHAVLRYLQFLREESDPVLQSLRNASIDDEEETEEERRLVQEAREELKRGEYRDWEEVRKELEVD